MRWIMRAKLIDSGGFAEARRTGESSPFGLWQMTQCSIAMRWLPCEKRMSSLAWQTLQFASVTSVRRGTTVVPVTAKESGWFGAPSFSVAGPFDGAGFSVYARRVSIEAVQVPVAAAGIAFVNVYVATPVVVLYVEVVANVVSRMGWPPATPPFK